MAYLIFSNVLPNLKGALCKMAETLEDLNNLNLDKNVYKIIEIDLQNFNSLKLNIKYVLYFNENDEVILNDNEIMFKKQIFLDSYIENFIKNIDFFLKNNLQHPKFTQWQNYRSQLVSVDTSFFNYPLKTSLEQYFQSLNKPFFNCLQIP